MMLKPLVLLASVLATLQVANGASFTEPPERLCCGDIIDSSTLDKTVLLLLALLDITPKTGLTVGVQCAPLVATCVGTTLSCEIALDGSLIGFKTKTVGLNCSPTTA
ncbi:hypothetical protein R3P38DRAFT_3278111 [Favolaschia claudopus]|uniref:Hydrophobin n=1 Tax=Favolaschia claudopus TaxID=2862362 RepID=A0AAW0ALP5_9AGAR